MLQNGAAVIEKSAPSHRYLSFSNLFNRSITGTLQALILDVACRCIVVGFAHGKIISYNFNSGASQNEFLTAPQVDQRSTQVVVKARELRDKTYSNPITTSVGTRFSECLREEVRLIHDILVVDMRVCSQFLLFYVRQAKWARLPMPRCLRLASMPMAAPACGNGPLPTTQKSLKFR